jgi:hypothetical protein
MKTLLLENQFHRAACQELTAGIVSIYTATRTPDSPSS